MIIADWIFIALIAFFCLLGLLIGFGKGLQFFTKGIFGIFIAVIICYVLGGTIYNFVFIQVILEKFVTWISGAGTFGQFLIKIHIDLIAYYVALFIVVLIIRLIIVIIVRNILETNNVILKVINKTFGMVFFVAVLAVLTLLVFQLIAVIGGTTSTNFLAKLQGSFFRLDAIYEFNPLLKIFKIEIVKEIVIT